MEFFRTNYHDKKIDEIKRFLDKIKIKKNDVILCLAQTVYMLVIILKHIKCIIRRCPGSDTNN